MKNKLSIKIIFKITVFLFIASIAFSQTERINTDDTKATEQQNRKETVKIQVLSEHQNCKKNDDCVLIRTECLYSYSSSCPDTSVNKKYEENYTRLYAECSKNVPAYQIFLYCPDQAKCIEGRCSIITSIDWEL